MNKNEEKKELEVKKEKAELETKDNITVGFGAFKSEDLEVTGLDVNSSDMKLPKIKLMQATSPEVTKGKGKVAAGQFFNTVTQEVEDEIDCVLLDQGKSMVYWKKPFKRGEDPLCRSFDGKVKTEGCGDGKCETCQYSSQNPKAWNNLKDGETKPDCNMSYVFLAKNCKTNMPFRIIVSGASVKSCKNFLNKLIPLRVAPFACKVTLKSHQEENDNGVFFVTDFENLRPNEECLENGVVNKEKYKELLDMSKAYKELFMTQIVQNDIVDVDEQDVNSGDETEEKLF